MSKYPRHNFKWGVNEILSLQREFELLNLSIDEIAQRHGRTPNAIMSKLDNEGMADYNVLYSNYHDLNSPMPVQKSKELDLECLSDDGSDEDYEDEGDDDEDYEDEGDVDDDDDEDDDPLSIRVDKLESDIKQIMTMLKELTNKNTLSNLMY